MDIFKLVGSVYVDTNNAENSLSKVDNAAEKTGINLGAVGKTVAAVGVAVGAAAVAAGKAMIDTAKETASNMDVIDKASQRMKIGAESYQELSHAASLCGVEMSTMEQAAKKLEGTDLNLDDALDQIYALGTAEERSAKAAELFGEKVAYNMTPMLNASGEEMAAMRQEAEDLGLVMSEDTVKAGANLNDTFTKVEESFASVKNEVGAALLPVVNDLLNWILDAMPKIKEYVGMVMDYVDQYMPVVIEWIEKLQPTVEKIKTVIVLLWENVLQPLLINVIIPVVKKVFDAVQWYWDHILSPLLDLIISVLSGEFFEKISETMDALKQKIEDIWTGIKDTIKGSVNSIIGFINSMITAVVGGINTLVRGLNTLKIDVPEWVTKKFGIEKFGFNIPEINAPQIPLLAKGGDILSEGSAIVGEAGAELVDLPKGATVTPLSDGKIEDLLTELIEIQQRQSAELYNVISRAIDGQKLKVNGREFGRLVREYA